MRATKSRQMLVDAVMEEGHKLWDEGLRPKTLVLGPVAQNLLADSLLVGSIYPGKKSKDGLKYLLSMCIKNDAAEESWHIEFEKEETEDADQ